MDESLINLPMQASNFQFGIFPYGEDSLIRETFASQGSLSTDADGSSGSRLKVLNPRGTYMNILDTKHNNLIQ